ncbi:hypothetical protein DRQ33_05120, partial [bacterium]
DYIAYVGPEYEGDWTQQQWQGCPSGATADIHHVRINVCWSNDGGPCDQFADDFWAEVRWKTTYNDACKSDGGACCSHWPECRRMCPFRRYIAVSPSGEIGSPANRTNFAFNVTSDNSDLIISLVDQSFSVAAVCVYGNFTGCPCPTITDNYFLVKNTSGANLMVVDEDGDAAIKGTLYQNNSSSPSGASFQFKLPDGTILGYVDMSGNLYIKGVIHENNTTFAPSGNDFVIQNSSGVNLLMIDGATGDLYCRKCLGQECSF